MRQGSLNTVTTPVNVAALSGNVFTGASQAGATTSVGLATTYTGLVLSNPAASGRKLILLRVSGSFTVAPSTITSVGLIAGYAAGGITAHTTPVTAFGSTNLIGAAVPVAKLDAAATLVGTPYWADWLAQAATATTAPNWARSYEGSIIIPPGAYVAIGTNIASPASGLLGAFMWQEVAV